MNQKDLSIRNYSLDLVRIIACCFVVLMHSPFPSKYAVGSFYSSISYFTAPCIGLFFMVSGALILPIKEDMGKFIGSRIKKFIYPTLTWTIIYLVLLWNSSDYPPPRATDIYKQLLSVPFSSQDYGVLWFMYTLIGLYLVAPIISPWLKEKKKHECRIVLMLWLITLFFPLLRNYLIIREDLSGPLYYFSGYIGYFLLGYYFETYKPRIPFFLWIPPVLISVIAPIIEYKLGFGIDKDSFWYLGIFIAVLASFIFYHVAIKHKREINNFFLKNHKLANTVKYLSKLSFGIYLVHLAVMRYFLWHIKWFEEITNCYIQTMISFCITMILSIILVSLLKKLPISKYIIAS